ncbi:MAG TPA: carbon storage regulator [Gammaproteobacteria bacterium]|jgi:sRNA-binding carbon storage regulator CsrA|nr:carbon storage regulator [Gammaproteobacteria bacterium]
MLVITRRENESITIVLADGVDPDLTLRDAFRQGPIEVRVVHVSGGRVRIAVSAPPELKIWRGPYRTERCLRPDAGDAGSEPSRHAVET